MEHPSMPAKILKSQNPDLLRNVSERTVQHRLQKDLGLPCRVAAKKPLLTKPMKKKRMAFCRKYLKWTEKDWERVVFSDESNFHIIHSAGKKVRRPQGSNRYASKYTVKTVKHPAYVMVWGCFSGYGGSGGLYFLPESTTMNGEIYENVLENELVPYKELLGMRVFMQDGAPCHRFHKVTNLLKEFNIQKLDWPGNSPDLNPIENCWAYMKRKLKALADEKTSLPKLKDAIRKFWFEDMDAQYFKDLAHSMPRRLKAVLKNNGEMSKY